MSHSPEDNTQERSVAEFLAEEFTDRVRRGEEISVDDFTRRYPDHADELRRLIQHAPTTTAVPPGDLDATSAFVAPAGQPLLPGKRLERLGDFRIVREIGRGGMGVVYEAVQESLGRQVALKVLLASSILDPKQLSRFQREARSAARLHHTNIVPVYGVGEYEGTHYYAMQFINGRGLDNVLAELRWLQSNPTAAATRYEPAPNGQAVAGPDDVTADDVAQRLLSGQFSLRDLTGHKLNESGPDDATQDHAAEAPAAPEPTEGTSNRVLARALNLGVPETSHQYWHRIARIGAEVADALGYAHAQGVLHRDIKPANLLLDTGGTMWIADFGLAKVAEQDNLTQTGDIIGTLRYMAPESFRGENDARTDIYALGLTLYELIALRPAFDASDRNGLIRQVTHAEIIPPRKYNEHVPADLETIVLKALEREPARRYGDAADLAADLERFIRDEPILARRATLLERLGRWYRHNPVVARLVFSLIGVFLLGFVGVTWGWWEANQERQRAEASEHKARQAAEEADAINHFLVEGMLGEATPEKAKGRKLTVEDALRQAAPKIEKSLAGQPDVEASVRSTVGLTFYRLGLYDDAAPHLRRVFELREKLLGPTARDTLAAMNNLAELLKAQSKYAEAEPLFRKSWELRKQEFGTNDPETLGALANLAQMLQVQGRLDEAQPLLEQCYDMYRQKYGDDAPDTLVTLGQLASLLQARGQFDKAEPMMRQALAGLQKGGHADDPYTLQQMHNLANLLFECEDKDKLAEAERLYRQTLDIRRRVLGEAHPDTRQTANGLLALLQRAGKQAEADALRQQLQDAALSAIDADDRQAIDARDLTIRRLMDQDKLDEAEPLIRQNIEATQRLLGPEHGDTLSARTQLAILMQSRGEMTQAEDMLREILATRRRVFGDHHRDTLVAVNNLVVALQVQGKLDEAEPLARRNLADCTAALGPDAVDTLLAKSFLAALLVARGRWAEAEPLARECVDQRVKKLGEDHPETLNAMDDLITLLVNEQKWSEAAPLAEKTLATRRKKLGNEHPDTIDSLQLLASIRQAEGKLEEAEKLVREIADFWRKARGPHSIETLNADSAVAVLMQQRGDSAGAEKLYREVLAAKRASLPADHPEIAETLGSLAAELLTANRAAEAEPLLREAVEIDRKKLPGGHWRTARLENLLGECLTTLKKYEEAEPLLLDSYGILQLHRPVMPDAADQALERAIRLYEAWGKPQEAETWKAKRQLKPQP